MFKRIIRVQMLMGLPTTESWSRQTCAGTSLLLACNHYVSIMGSNPYSYQVGSYYGCSRCS
jgi:hypothetical protein